MGTDRPVATVTWSGVRIRDVKSRGNCTPDEGAYRRHNEPCGPDRQPDLLAFDTHPCQQRPYENADDQRQYIDVVRGRKRRVSRHVFAAIAHGGGQWLG